MADGRKASGTQRLSRLSDGSSFMLRPLQPGDAQDRLRCGRNAEFVRMCGGDGRRLQSMTLEAATAWYGRLARAECAWAIDLDGRCIGSARLHHIDAHDRRARYAIGIFDPECWGRGIGTQVTRLVLAHAFGSMGLHRVDLRVLEYNHRAITCYKRCGFRIEGRERQSAWVEDAWHDDLMMSILEDEFTAPTADADGDDYPSEA